MYNPKEEALREYPRWKGNGLSANNMSFEIVDEGPLILDQFEGGSN